MIDQGDPNGIVISGISGVFPNSENVEEFKENLLNGNDMISKSTRPNFEDMNFGLLKTIDRFDHSFFGITHNHAKNMTIASRMILEKTFEAILDAGYNPREIKGKNIAVICGVWESTNEGDPALDQKLDRYIDIMGRTLFMMANRISNWLDLHGPSYSVNTACSSSLYAIDQAIKAIQRGQCEGAIVCAANFCFAWGEYYKESSIWSPEGNSAPFDVDANGYVRAEAVGALFLQKKNDARRIYTHVIHSTTNCDGFKEEGLAFPSITQQIQLYRQFYDEIGMDPKKISFIEAHGTGTKAGDIVEGTSIYDFFCANRTTPLKIGSLKSNMGHAEAAAALCGIIKLIIAFETGIIPPNLRYKNPNPKIEGLLNGRLEVVSKPTPLEGEYFALNSFGIGGSNGHAVFSPHTKVKCENNSLNENFPRLAVASGRTEEAVECILNNAEQNHNDAEYIRLLHEIFKYGINGHLHRGYTILYKNEKSKKSIKSFSGEKRPIWFVFSGMGSQWPAMGKSLMGIPIFAESIQKSHQVLLSKGLDLIKIITDENPQMFDNILNSFVGIAAIQIALLDILKKLNITPDGIVGHSLGELGCAYVDGCFTAEQMILSAYYRGLVSLETDLIHGTMAAVGENYKCMKDLVPSEIDIACHNGPTSCTISGPTQITRDFIKDLEEKKIFVREVNSSNIAYHSRYIASAGPRSISYLKKVIPEPKLRSNKWICTSAPEHEWDNDNVKYSSAEYHTNNMLNPVYFEESYHHIPNNAITIEIAPHGLLQAVLKRSLPTTVDNISLTLRNHKNSIEYLLNAFGRLYEMGCDMELSHLYPPVEFPVSKLTPMISPLIKWRHDEQWSTDQIYSDQSSERKFVFNVKNKDNEYLRGHNIDGRNLYPGFGYLWMVIETLAGLNKRKVMERSIALENIHFENPLIIPNRGSLHFTVSIQEITKYFQVKGNGVIVAHGRVRVLDTVHKEMVDVAPYFDKNSYSGTLPMSKDDFYKELRLRGYHYEGLFKSVELVNCDGQYAEISWRNNLVCFMDAMAQTTLLHLDNRDVLLPTFLDKIIIDFKKHFEILESLDKEDPKFPVCFDPHYGILCSGGIQMGGWKGVEMTRQKNRNEPIHRKYQFFPYISEKRMTLIQAVRICVEITLKNSLHGSKAITYEILDQEYNSELKTISSVISLALNDVPLVKPNVNILINSEKVEETKDQGDITISNKPLPRNKSASLIVISNIQNKTDLFESIFDTLKDEGFIITTISINDNTLFENLGFNVCFSRIISDSEKLILLGKKTKSELVKKAVQIKNSTYSWIPELQNAMSNLKPENDEKLVVFAEKEPTSGILGFYNCLRKEEKGKHSRCFYIIDDSAPTFSLDNLFYKAQFEKNLRYNVYKDGEWGSYWHSILEPSTDEKATHAFCMLSERGNLSSFKWVQGSQDPSKYNANGGALIHIYYSSLNFKDVMLSVGRISVMDYSFSPNRLIECHEGVEYSGKNENGERVMGIVHNKAIATLVESIPYITWRVPDTMTLEEAATIPVVYSTVIYAFFFKMKLKKGCSILIHSGSGGIGQAAINICLHYKCNIFTTVGTPEKVEFIRKTFPQIPESHIGTSRDTSFLHMIMKQTTGKGVDVVLNSLSEDKLRASVRCVARGGDFLEIGKFDMAKNNSLELGHFVNDIEFHSVQLNIVLLEGPSKKADKISKKLQEMLNQGIVKPITRKIFQSDEVESAFRYMASGKHLGKLVIKIRNEEQDLKSKPTLLRFKVKPRVLCHKNKSYVILGGLGGFGMEMVDWLIIRGARNVVLSSRKGVKNGYQSYRIKLWRSYGVNVLISTADIYQETDVKEILELANSLGPVAGIFNLAMVLEDGQFLNQTEENFKTVADPKSTATVHLDKLSRKMCPYLEYFIVFSSIACGYGNNDQTNYGFANSIMERICEMRCADNLPGLAIQWGALGEVGYFSELSKYNPSITIRVAQQEVKSCLETLDCFMTQPNPIVLAMIVTEKHKTDLDIINIVAKLLGIKDVKTISLTSTLAELGMDSILGMELKQILEAEFNIFLTPEDLRSMTFAKLYQLKDGKETNTVQKKPSNLLKFFLNDEFWNQPVLQIPFKEGKIQEQLSLDESPTVFVFPGMEGLALMMEPLAKNLPLQTLCFQYHFVETENSVHKLRDHFSSYVLKNLRPKQEFCFIGYSFGSVIALEVAKILEKQGRKGHIWLIDGSPALVEMTIEMKYKENNILNNEMLQNRVCIRAIQTLMPELSKEGYEKYIEKTTGWEYKKKLCLSILSHEGKTAKHLSRLIDRSYDVLKVISEYKRTYFPLQSSCILIRCVENVFDLPLDESYNLTEHFKNPVEVHKINDVDHYSILLHSQISEIIMKSFPLLSKSD